MLYRFFTLCATLNKHLPPIYGALPVFIFRFLFKITTHSYMQSLPSRTCAPVCELELRSGAQRSGAPRQDPADLRPLLAGQGRGWRRGHGTPTAPRRTEARMDRTQKTASGRRGRLRAATRMFQGDFAQLLLSPGYSQIRSIHIRQTSIPPAYPTHARRFKCNAV